MDNKVRHLVNTQTSDEQNNNARGNIKYKNIQNNNNFKSRDAKRLPKTENVTDLTG